ncbi:MAG: hypothetical protein KGJ09_07355 [Candidatus Omnitrophica bacterium]|nr:hypothetical protein [Candidatus Omnitrophota bacterium]MDE2009879.1 hypothetical protein [Candidatus Omnitrophota bacterium]MDE2214339.1 hypothetical protein [Candidatus Omnitrophota bacterium]MDE2231088.1 hypothetical protein [Candidatus Omnitrophota bacterium]
MSELVFNRVILERNNRTLMIISFVSLALNFILVLSMLRVFHRPPLVVFATDGKLTVLKTKDLGINETLLKDFVRLVVGQYLSFSVNSLPHQIDSIKAYLGPKPIQNILQSYKDNQTLIQSENISQQFIVDTITVTKKSSPYWVKVTGLSNIHTTDSDKNLPMTYVFEVTRVKSTQTNPYGFLMTDVVEKDKSESKGPR